MDDINVVNNDLELLSVSESLICKPEDITKHLLNAGNGLKIIHLNIRSINRNFDNLSLLLNRITTKLDIIILSECWLSKCPFIPSLPGFDNFESDFSNQNDGVVVYIRNGIHCNVEYPSFCEANCLLLKLSHNIAIIALYRSPSFKSIEPFLNSLDVTINSLNNFNTTIIIGDVNINILPSTSHPGADDYLNLLASHAMLPAHLLPTRENKCIDHVILRSSNPAITMVLDSFITDHAPILLCCYSKFDDSNKKRYFTKTDIPSVVKQIESTDFSFVVTARDPNVLANDLVSKISTIIKENSQSVPIPSRKRIIKPWITPGLLRCIRNKDKLFRNYKQDPKNNTLKVTYTRYRNYCNRLLKNVKQEYEQNEIIKVKKSSRATWNAIKRIGNFQKQKSNASSLLKLSETPAASVNTVNNFFANVGSILASQVKSSFASTPLHSPTMHSSSVSNSMVLYEVENEEIDNIILNLKSKCAVGWDGISTYIVKATRHVLTPILQVLFNLSLTSGIFPNAFKKAVVHPIYKSGDRDSVTNYRPISVLSVFSKVFEKVLNTRLIQFVKSNNILSNNQFGFRTGKSTEDAVLELTDTVTKNLDKKLKTVGIFLDLSKAFDTVSVPILLGKLEHIGIRGIALDMFRSYLTSREQYVMIDDFTSTCENILFGVPQGSVLGPTLFLLYINDLCNLILTNCKIIVYADDTTLLVHGKSWEDARSHAENALRSVMLWLNSNLLTLNLSKTQLITFSLNSTSSPPPSFVVRAHSCNTDDTTTCCCVRVVNTPYAKYLGVIIDKTLAWKPHIDHITSRTRKLLYVFRKLRSILDHSTLKVVYMSLAQSVLSYCVTSWGAAAKTHMLKIERAQRAVLKVMIRKPIRFPTAELYSICQVPTVRQLFILQTILRKHSQTPFYPHIINNTRRYYKVCKTESCRTKCAQRHFYYISSTLYNRLNKTLSIYPLTQYKCKMKCTEYLMSLSYDDTEDLLEFAK